MGHVCSCTDSNGRNVPIRVYNEQEILLLIKVQSLIRVKLAKLKLRRLKATLQA